VILFLAFLKRNWQAIAVICIVSGAAWWLYRSGVQNERERVEQQYAKQYAEKVKGYEEQIEQYKKDKVIFEEREAQYQARNAEIGKAYQDLLLAIPKMGLVKYVQTKPDCPPVPSITPQYRLCFNAATGGDTKTIAACQASGLLKPLPGTGRVVLPNP
jgi:hypothetical protein